MTVYLLVNDAPEEFGGYRLIAIYEKRVKAQKRLKVLRKKDPYGYQYWVVLPRTVITGYARRRARV